MLPDQGVALVVVEAEPVGHAPGRGALQVDQGPQVPGPAQPAQRQVRLPPAQHGPGPGVQVGDRQRRADQEIGWVASAAMVAGELEGVPDGLQVRAAGLRVADHANMLTGAGSEQAPRDGAFKPSRRSRPGPARR